jgi:hypothetical protein
MKYLFDPKKGGLIVVLTTIFGPGGKGMARMALDTGAVGSLVSREFLTGLGYDPVKDKERVPNAKAAVGRGFQKRNCLVRVNY